MTLKTYRQKRDFKLTPEPRGVSPKKKQPIQKKKNKQLFIIQKHAASHLHYDFRLQLDNVLLSWAVPKGPSLDPTVKRLAMHVEDHPLEYGTFEGIIPKGQYGGGTVMLWDKGTWQCEGNAKLAYRKGLLSFTLKAKKLNGKWKLIRIGHNDKTWLLIKVKDEFAKSSKHYDITLKQPNSVKTQQSLDEITKNYRFKWDKNGLATVKRKSREIVNKIPKTDIINKPHSKKISKANTEAQSSDLDASMRKHESTKLSINQTKVKALSKIKLELPKTKLPRAIYPQLATLVTSPPVGDKWLYEIKLDGFRLLIFKHGNKVNIYTRNQNDWTHKFQKLANQIKQLPITNLILDGEIVVLDDTHKSNFQLLQNSLGENAKDFIYYAFDLLYYDRYRLLDLPLIERKEILKKILACIKTDGIIYNDHVIGDGELIFKKSCELGLEGIVCKRLDGPYQQKRDKTWLKVKCVKRQEFVIGGFLPSARRRFFRSLLLGTFNQAGELLYHGNVGTGFTQASLESLHQLLSKHIIDHMPFKNRPPGSAHATWVKPVLIAEIEFSEWTQDNTLRHPSFKGLRQDKSAKQIHIEKALNVVTGNKKTPHKRAKIPKKDISTHKLTNPNKILYPEGKITKQQVAEYYTEIQEYILPYIVERPLTIVRCPHHYEHCFYQKHLQHNVQNLFGIRIKEKHGSNQYIYIKDAQGLMALTQLSALELHPWGSKIDNVEHPDTLIFDLDPAPDIAWKILVSAALEVKAFFDNLKLRSFVKTTGGKGLHIVVPFEPQHSWDVVKNFAKMVVDYLVLNNPKKYVAVMTKSKRTGKIFIDYLRNGRGATAIAPYSTRARKFAPVATPLFWDELANDRRDTLFTIKNLPNRIRTLKEDPWNDYYKIKQFLRVPL